MQVYKYTLKLLDPLFYSLEGFSGAYTPPMIHATALNFAALSVLNHDPAGQPYIMSDSNGGRNIPRYTSSRASHVFYFTPGRLSRMTSMNYFLDLTKGEHDRYLQRTAPGEPLKISRLYFISPETIFEGYLLLTYSIELADLQLIRLGSFRGKAELFFGELKIKKEGADCYADHLVDPLVSKVKRGVFKNILPYPLIDNALVAKALICKEGKKDVYVALPETEFSYDPQVMRDKLNNLKKALDKMESLSNKERCKLLMYLMRSAVSIYYYLSGITTEKFLSERLREIEGFLDLRDTIRDKKFELDDWTIGHLTEVVKGKINDCEKKIQGEEESQVIESSGNGSPTLIL